MSENQIGEVYDLARRVGVEKNGAVTLQEQFVTLKNLAAWLGQEGSKGWVILIKKTPSLGESRARAMVRELRGLGYEVPDAPPERQAVPVPKKSGGKVFVSPLAAQALDVLGWAPGEWRSSAGVAAAFPELAVGQVTRALNTLVSKGVAGIGYEIRGSVPYYRYVEPGMEEAVALTPGGPAGPETPLTAEGAEELSHQSQVLAEVLGRQAEELADVAQHVILASTILTSISVRHRELAASYAALAVKLHQAEPAAGGESCPK